MRILFAMAGVLAAGAASPGEPAPAAEGTRPPRIPVIDGPGVYADGDWWTIAGNPDLGDYTGEGQQPVDFAVWQASDGTWQLWSCVRNTKCGGNGGTAFVPLKRTLGSHGRLFYRWEGKALTDTDWQPKGIAMMADPSVGETRGGLQAPHVVRWNASYFMAYGDWDNICFAVSKDGKIFTRRLRENGKTGAFSEGARANTRDPMLLRIGGIWHCYYTAFPDGAGRVYCRTSPDLLTWGESVAVASGGQAGTGPCSAECPQVVELERGEFYLFRTQRYGEDAQTSVYCSDNPLRFGTDDDQYLVCTMALAAPEIVISQGEYYIASLLPSLKGIRMARLRWVDIQEAAPALAHAGRSMTKVAPALQAGSSER